MHALPILHPELLIYFGVMAFCDLFTKMASTFRFTPFHKLERGFRDLISVGSPHRSNFKGKDAGARTEAR
jgi:hypothetical protein